ncbi:helix-turn-helix domain-containing protein [Spirosoma utsteinense]|uniref:AraC-like DNA-binding protein n=1 Tax=Spirosoma utsteinense TaxID=2585773 RepID=A0ABR6WEK9_9BACT|nr:helix-turn-helix domain-containing protein [Spirosoma utsteinense]MBC3788287.1 AraC-like DNA-binding protein [Spirosoma utsteinense]MBC3794985.1 AraC-like DNA-binding protein [Spirosoma utsteinense]
MPHTETIEELYKARKAWLPSNLRHELGHFNVFRLDDVGKGAKPSPYRKRDWYNITLVHGPGKYLYADKKIDVRKHALVFDNPQVPFGWEQRDRITGGFFCVFSPDFFHSLANPTQYSIFQPGGHALFELTAEEASQANLLFERMFSELRSDYLHKYDLLRALLLEVMHLAMKMAPNENLRTQVLTASQRITVSFLERLEQQFPIDSTEQAVSLRSAIDFAPRLNVHVNHLNRVVKETTGKTTTQIIAERILQEAKILLRNTPWSISEISYALGFGQPAHFNNFFRKHTESSPLTYRHV